MKGEILRIETVQEITGTKNLIERLKRDKNLSELENKELFKKITKLDMENHYLKKREATLIALENSLPQRIENYKKKNTPDEVIKELQFISDMLMMEKEKLLNKEGEVSK